MKSLAVAVTVVALFYGFLIVTRKGTIAAERDHVIAAPPAVVYGVLTDPLKLADYSGLRRVDPAVQVTAAGAAGVDWQGAGVGRGHAERTVAEPSSAVSWALTYTEPSAAPVTLQFKLEPKGEGTRVTWRYEAQRGLAEKARALVMDFDRTLGPSLEAGLEQLGTLAQAAVPAPPPAPEQPPAPLDAAADAGATP